MFRIIFILTLVAIFVALAECDVISMIPLEKTGYAFRRGAKGSNVLVEMYIDLTCSSCLDSWPVLSQVYKEYSDKVEFSYRLFPLPYHQQAFITAKAAQVVYYTGNQDAVFTFFDTAFAQQEFIYNSVTNAMTYDDVVKLVGTWAQTNTGVTSEEYTNGMNSSTIIGKNSEMGARYMWKYTTLQGVFATPFFAINGLQVGGLDTLNDWKVALDSLLA